MKAAKKCTNFLLEVTVWICKVLCCHTTDLLNLTDSSVKLSANLLLQQQQQKKKGINGQVSCSATFCHLLILFKYPQTTFSIPPITRVTDKSSLSSLKEENYRRQRFFFFFFFFVCMTVGALENNDECRKHDFSMPPVTQVLNKNSLSLALKVDFLWPIF